MTDKWIVRLLAALLALSMPPLSASAQPGESPVKIFIEAKPADGGNEKAAKDVGDTTRDLEFAVKNMPGELKGFIELASDAASADVVVAVRGRRQAAIGPKKIEYTMHLGRGVGDFVFGNLGGVWSQAASAFAAAMAAWVKEDGPAVRRVIARKGSEASRAVGLAEFVEARWGSDASTQLKALGNEGLAAGVPPALAMLRDDKERVRVYGAAYLKEMSGQNYRTDRAKWEQWWASHPASRPQ